MPPSISRVYIDRLIKGLAQSLEPGSAGQVLTWDDDEGRYVPKDPSTAPGGDHAETHAVDGQDPITPASIGARSTAALEMDLGKALIDPSTYVEIVRDPETGKLSGANVWTDQQKEVRLFHRTLSRDGEGRLASVQFVRDADGATRTSTLVRDVDGTMLGVLQAAS